MRSTRQKRTAKPGRKDRGCHTTTPGASPRRASPCSTHRPKEDFEALQRTEQELQQARDYAQAIVEAVPPLLVLDSDLRVKTANESFYKHFRVSPPQTEDCLVYELGNGQWLDPDTRRITGANPFMTELLDDPNDVFLLQHTGLTDAGKADLVAYLKSL